MTVKSRIVLTKMQQPDQGRGNPRTSHPVASQHHKQEADAVASAVKSIVYMSHCQLYMRPHFTQFAVTFVM